MVKEYFIFFIPIFAMATPFEKKSFRIQKIIGRLLTAFFCILLWQGCFKFRKSDPKVLQEFEQKGINVRIHNFYYSKDNKIHYVETGDTTAPTIYFVHGTPGSWNNFRDFLADSLLGKQYRIIALDRPGFGYSNFGKAETMETQVDAFNRMIAAKDNGQPVVLVGHSLGGPIIAGMSAKDTGIAHTLLIIAGSISPELEPKEGWRKPLGSPVFSWLAPGAMRPSNEEMLDFKKYVNTMPEALGNITAEVYIMHGTKDMFVPFGNLAYTEQHLQKAKKVYTIPLEGENHFLPWTRFSSIRDLFLHIRKELN